MFSLISLDPIFSNSSKASSFSCIVVYISVVTLAGITSSGILTGTEDFNIGHGCVL